MLGTIEDSICEWWVTCRCVKCGTEERPINHQGRQVPVTQREAVLLFERCNWKKVQKQAESEDLVEFTVVLVGTCPDCCEE